jgi:tol-pal system protein YbgF
MRQAIASIPAPAPIVPIGEPGEPGMTPPAPTTPAPPINVSHQRVYDLSYNDYIGGQFELAITGFDSYIRTYPTSPLADDAQLNIGNAYYGWGKYKEAVDALQKVIRDYPKSDTVAAAYYKLGQAYTQLNMIDPARKAYETVLQNYPDSIEHSLARQALERLDRMKRKDEELSALNVG